MGWRRWLCFLYFFSFFRGVIEFGRRVVLVRGFEMLVSIGSRFRTGYSGF